jgi:hypothetical protein
MLTDVEESLEMFTTFVLRAIPEENEQSKRLSCVPFQWIR